MEVTVRVGPSATVAVGRRPAAPAGSGLVLLAGVDVHVDPSAPDDPPFALVHDADEAEAGLRALYGIEVADAVLTAEETIATEITVVPGRAAAATRRLGLVRWLETYSPDDLPATLLDLEFGAAAAELDHLLSDTDADEAADRLRRRAAATAALSRRLRTDGARSAPAGLVDLLAAALPAVASAVSLDDPAADDVTHEVELAAALRSLGVAGITLDWDVLTAQAGIATRDPVGAKSRDTPRDLLDVERTTSVDWWQVPRGVLRTDEDTVTWRLTDGGTTVRVAVAAASRAPAAALGFRLYADADTHTGSVPIAVGALHLSADGRTFDGAAPVFGEPTGELVLDVHDPAAERPARLGADRTSARATRWSARGISALRLGSAASLALDEAAYLFERVADEHRRPADRRRAARRGARCRAVEWSLAVRLGEIDADDAPASAEPPLHPSDVRLPDLGGPGWQPLVAETALAADSGWRD